MLRRCDRCALRGEVEKVFKNATSIEGWSIRADGDRAAEVLVRLANAGQIFEIFPPITCQSACTLRNYYGNASAPMNQVAHRSNKDQLPRTEGSGRTVGQLFDDHRERLKLTIRLRLDHRLRGRVDASDVLQEAYLEALQRYPDYLQDQPMPLFLWLRFIAVQKLHLIHRRHLRTKARDAGREISLNQPLPQASSEVLAAQLVGKHSTPSQAAMRLELQARLQEALESMNPIDREILALRHFEQLTNSETAQVLGLKESTASQRYGRALLRLNDLLLGLPGFTETQP